MTYNHVIFNRETLEKVGEIVTNHSISIADAIDLLEVTYLDKVNIWDPDLMIDGKEQWSDDLDMLLEDDFYALRIRNSSSWDDVIPEIEAIMDKAGLTDEWKNADGDTFEDVIRMAQDKLGIDLGL